jgi:hypothetical protein
MLVLSFEGLNTELTVSLLPQVKVDVVGLDFNAQGRALGKAGAAAPLF